MKVIASRAGWRAPFVSALALCAFFACDGKKATVGGQDAGMDAALRVPVDGGVADSGAFDAAGPEAANEHLIKRYEDETRVDHAPQTVKTTTASVFVSVPRTDMVATIKKGDSVTQLAERLGYYLVTFADPADSARRLMGWAAKYAFEDNPAFAPGTKVTLPKCTGLGTEVVVLQDSPRCGYPCKSDYECGAGSSCEVGVEVPPNGVLPATATYTTVCTPIPGVPIVDAGTRPSLFGTTFEYNGKCPRSYIPAPKVGDICYRTCKTDIDCPSRATCRVAPGGVKLCYLDWK